MPPHSNDTKNISDVQMGKLIQQVESLVDNVKSLNESIVDVKQKVAVLDVKAPIVTKEDLTDIQHRLTAMETTLNRIDNDVAIEDLYKKYNSINDKTGELDKKIVEINARRVTLAEVFAVLIAIGSAVIAWFKGN